MVWKSMKISRLWKFYFWLVLWLFVFVPAFIWPISLNGIWIVISRIIGILLIVYSLFLTSTGGRSIARFGHLEEHETFWPDKFTEFGIFKCMRHPMHLGLALFPLALALISGLVLAICGAGWGVAGALWFVLQVEEKDTLDKFGQTYSDYMQRVPPFSLKIACIKTGFKIWQSR